MKLIVYWALCLLTLFIVPLTQTKAALVDPKLKQFVSQKSAIKQKVVILFKIPKHIPAPQRYQRKYIIQYLHFVTQFNLNELNNFLLNSKLNGRDFRIINTFWINASISAELNSKALAAISNLPIVHKIYSNGKTVFPKLTTYKKFVNTTELPYNFIDTQLNRLISEAPELDGRSVSIGHIDTGVDEKHVDLKGKVQLFFDGNKIGEPKDSDSHGTHTAGIILGAQRVGKYIGVAPGAKLISAGHLEDYDQMLRGMQWLLDPDGNPQTADSPRVVSNSWNADGAPDMELFYRAINSWEAAGIVTVFSAGNAGPSDESITRPHEHPYVIAVGATGPNGKIAQFSSRGPATYYGEKIDKPDITAPGVSINSTLPHGSYGSLSGTSMACPHVAGTVALILQANPQLNPLQVKEILRVSATPVDLDGNEISVSKWNKAYGFGKLNIYKAVTTSLSLRRDNFILQSWIEYFRINIKGMDLKYQPPSLGEQNFTIPFDLEESNDEGGWISSEQLQF